MLTPTHLFIVVSLEEQVLFLIEVGSRAEGAPWRSRVGTGCSAASFLKWLGQTSTPFGLLQPGMCGLQTDSRFSRCPGESAGPLQSAIMIQLPHGIQAGSLGAKLLLKVIISPAFKGKCLIHGEMQFLAQLASDCRRK